MIKKTKVASYSTQKMNSMDKAKRLLTKRGVQFTSSAHNQQIVIRTHAGKVVYYPLRGEYQHGMLRGYVENTESMIAYVSKHRIINKPTTEEVPISVGAYADKGFAQVVLENPVEILDDMQFSANDSPLVVEHKIAICKGYGHAIHRCNEILSGLTKGSTEHAEVYLYVSKVNGVMGFLKEKYPFLQKGGAAFSENLLDCLKEDISEVVWRSYADRAHQRMIDVYFHGASYE